MEAGLASSASFRDLCSRAVVAVLRSTDPYQVDVRAELGVAGIRFLAILFDAKGETLGCGVYQAPRPSRTAEAHDGFVDEVRTRLARSESLQELQRRWEKSKTDADLIQALARRYEEVGRPHGMAELCETASATATAPDRFTLRLHAFNLRANDPAWIARDAAAPEKIVRDGEWLLRDRPDHPDHSTLISAMFNYGLCSMFDVPRKTGALLQKLTDAPALKAHAELLKRTLDQWKESREEEVRLFPKMEPSARAIIAAQFGDAERTIAAFEDATFEDIRQLTWLKEAKAVLGRK